MHPLWLWLPIFVLASFGLAVLVGAILAFCSRDPREVQ